MCTSPAGSVRAALRACLTAAVVLFAAPHAALAVSTRDLVELAQAGVGEEVLVALVQSDDTVYDLDASAILDLRARGLSDPVIAAMLRNGRSRPRLDTPEYLPPQFEPEAAPMDALLPPPVVALQPQVVVVPWIPARRHHRHPPKAPAPRVDAGGGFGRFMNDGWVDGRPPSGAR